LILVIAIAFLAGCSGTPLGRIDAAGSRTGSVPVARAPQLPLVANRHSVKGALATAGYYFEALGWATATGDRGELQRVPAPDCLACLAFIRAIAETHPAVPGLHTVVDSARLLHHRVYLGAQLGVDVEFRWVYDTQLLARAIDAGPQDWSIWLSWIRGRWTVVDLTPDL
jgi:hypothetical protein